MSTTPTPTARFFGYGELPLVLMALLVEGPAGAYELMAQLDRRFGPAYKASPGGTYPAIEALHEQKLITTDEGRPKRYQITRLGRKALDERMPDLAAIEMRTGVALQSGATTDAELARFVARTRDHALRVAPDDLARVLNKAATEIERRARKAGNHD